MGEAHHKKTCQFVFEPSWVTTREPTVGSSEEGASVYTTEEAKGVEKVAFFAFSTPFRLYCCAAAVLVFAGAFFTYLSNQFKRSASTWSSVSRAA